MFQSSSWRSVLVESVVIVVSILLAFGIDAWWEERGRSGQEAAFLRGLIEDLREDYADYSRFTSIQEDRVLAADLLLALVGGELGRPEQLSNAEAVGMTTGRAFGMLGRISYLDAVLVTYDQMASANAANVIDPQLWKEVSAYYSLAIQRSGDSPGLDRVERYVARLEELGYSIEDDNRIPAQEIVSDSQLRAIIRNIKSSAEIGVLLGTEIMDETEGLIERLEGRIQ